MEISILTELLINQTKLCTFRTNCFKLEVLKYRTATQMRKGLVLSSIVHPYLSGQCRARDTDEMGNNYLLVSELLEVLQQPGTAGHMTSFNLAHLQVNGENVANGTDDYDPTRKER